MATRPFEHIVEALKARNGLSAAKKPRADDEDDEAAADTDEDEPGESDIDDDQPKKKKKAKPRDQDDGDEQCDVDEEDENDVEKKKRSAIVARQIVAAGARARGETPDGERIKLALPTNRTAHAIVLANQYRCGELSFNEYQQQLKRS
jgi:hypothetical protein